MAVGLPICSRAEGLEKTFVSWGEVTPPSLNETQGTIKITLPIDEVIIDRKHFFTFMHAVGRRMGDMARYREQRENTARKHYGRADTYTLAYSCSGGRPRATT